MATIIFRTHTHTHTRIQWCPLAFLWWWLFLAGYRWLCESTHRCTCTRLQKLALHRWWLPCPSGRCLGYLQHWSSYPLGHSSHLGSPNVLSSNLEGKRYWVRAADTWILLNEAILVSGSYTGGAEGSPQQKVHIASFICQSPTIQSEGLSFSFWVKYTKCFARKIITYKNKSPLSILGSPTYFFNVGRLELDHHTWIFQGSCASWMCQDEEVVFLWLSFREYS